MKRVTFNRHHDRGIDYVLSTAIRVYDFFKKPDGPVGMLVGGFIVAIALFTWLNPYYNEIQRVTSKVPIHTQKISDLEKKQDKFEDRFEQVEKSQEDLRENQLLLLCSSPYVGESWKQRKKCDQNGYGSK